MVIPRQIWLAVIAGAAVLLATLWTAIPLTQGGPGYLQSFVVRFLLLFVVYLGGLQVIRGVAVTAWPVRWVVWTVAITTRLFLVFLEPLRLSGDLFRYLWDGRLILAGVNPYGVAPSDPSLANFQDWIHYAAMGFKDVPTIYPPMAELFFAGLAGIAGDSLIVARLLLVALELGGVVWLSRILPDWRSLTLWLWHPLAMFEIAYSGHIDVLVMVLVVGMLWSFHHRRDFLAGLLLGLAGLTKLYPLLLGAAFWRWPRKTEGLSAWRLPVTAVGVVLLGLIPLLISGGPWATMRWFMATGGFNAPVADWLGRLVGLWVAPEGARLIAGLIALTLLGAIAIRMLFDSVPSQDRMQWVATRTLLVITAISLLGPSLNPWYLLWLLPVLCLRPNLPLQLLTGTVVLSYTFFAEMPAALAPWLMPLEFLPPLAALLYDYRLRKRVKPS